MYPIRIGAVEDFAIVRELLRGANFHETAAAARLGVPLLTQQTIDQCAADQCAAPEGNPADLLDLLIRLFVRNVHVDEQAVRDHLTSAQITALERLGLIARERSWYSPVCLCPVGEIYTVSDRWKAPDGKKLEGLDDIVYPAVVPNTRLFLDLLPQSRCESFLDLCSGTGVAAMIAASQYAVQAHAYDIAPRSTHFAEFARLLNDLANVTAGTGDLYEPAAGAMFDRIVAHPPYVPVLESQWIFFDGGDDGERVTRRIIEQAPRYLRPGGMLYCLAMASDRADRPLEDRIREWLGPHARQFDVALVVRRVIDPREFALKDAGQAPRWKELFEARHVTGLPYAMMMVQRKAAGREPFTARRQTGPKTGRREHEWLLEWETAAADEPGAVLSARLRASEDCELRTVSRLDRGDWDGQSYNLEIDHPFRMAMKIDPWIAYLLTRADGTKTGSELLDLLKAEGVISVDVCAGEFAQVLNALVSGGFLIMSPAAESPAPS